MDPRSPLPLCLSDLDFEYPEELVATQPSQNPRVLLSKPTEVEPIEISKDELLALPKPGDLFVINNTKVQKRRVFSDEGLEILFVGATSEPLVWEVLFPAKRYKTDKSVFNLPGDLRATLIQKGLPQKLRLSREIGLEYFNEFGEMPLPPYIQEARSERHNISEDESWYQTAWAQVEGSQAAPTASLHFTAQDMQGLKDRGIGVCELTLHVGLGTFLPVRTENLDEHEMHKEQFQIPASVIQALKEAKSQGHKIWSLGTTSTRAIESFALEKGEYQKDGSFVGNTDLFIRPGFDFKFVDVLLTNFHQPKSTLVALVGGFAGLDRVKSAYSWAIARKFRLFSYGDLSVWFKT